jgi:thiosulfate/3-mercaptopyruvate sulfurtransferase
MYRTLIQAEELRAHLDDADWVVVDCRYDLTDHQAGRRAYLEGHVPGAVYVDMETDLSAPKAPGTGRHPLPSPLQLTALFGRLGIGNGAQVVVYDAAGGMMAARFWWLLRYMGHEPVAVLDGGWPSWRDGGNPAASGEQSHRRVEFHGQPREDLLVQAEAVLNQPCLVDSRDPARYRGEVEPLDPVAGHIPGAINYFCKNNLDGQGRFQTATALRAQLAAVFGSTPAEQATFYCGSGVTACHNILAAVHAGFPQSRLYPGSWSEWCADPARPVASGDTR